VVVALQSGASGADPIRPDGAHEVERRIGRQTHVATGTFACPACDAPVAPAPGGMSPAAAVSCPYCGFAAFVRDFLSLGEPTRPARVVVRVVPSARGRR
jgi:DNA-directed RNA polymerase subunit RPC12/RpoP